MWREFILEHDPGAELFQPATRAQLQQLEDHYQVTFPSSYIDLMMETNGVITSGHRQLFHPVVRLRSFNDRFRTSEVVLSTHMPVDCFWFFGAFGSAGSVLGFRIVQNKAREDIFAWDPVTDSRLLVANSLKRFIVAWCKRQL